MSPRQQVFHELLQTETNYVKVLHTVVTVRGTDGRGRGGQRVRPAGR